MATRLAERVAANIKALRERAGLTQEQLADKAGITRGYLARVETARHEPSLSMLAQIARALRVKVGNLVE